MFLLAALRLGCLAGEGRGAQQFVGAVGPEIAAEPPLHEPGGPLAVCGFASVQRIVDGLRRFRCCLFAFHPPRFAFG